MKKILLAFLLALIAGPAFAQAVVPATDGADRIQPVALYTRATGAPLTNFGSSPVPSSLATNAVAATRTTVASGSLVAKASAGNLYDWQVTAGASAGYVLVHNATSAPADGVVTPFQCVAVAANATVGSSTQTMPERYTTGIVLVFSTTGCFTQTTSATAFIRARVQ